MANFLKNWFRIGNPVSQADATDGGRLRPPDPRNLDRDLSMFQYSETLSTSPLTGSGVQTARSRQIIYQKYQRMMGNPLVSGALRLHVTAALGGHETTGDVVFIETAAARKGDKKAEKEVEILCRELAPIFNRIAMSAAYNAVAFGDSYVRIYPKKGRGVIDALMDETLLPPLVLPYEQGNTTRICEVAIGPRVRERLTMDQIARLKMPRMLYTPQPLAQEKAWRTAILQDDPDSLPLMPSLVGGSFLADAEEQYDYFIASMVGLVGQRVLDSIDESIMTVQVNGMTKEQQQSLLASIKKMLVRSKEIAEETVKSGIPLLRRIRHALPVTSEKQIVALQGLNSSGGSGGGRSGNISIEDVLMHAKMLSGALGIDLSMLGFADLMSGGLGEGGFFRTSAQSAERSRSIRLALTDMFNNIIDVHLIYRDGKTYDPADRPWVINFFGTISSLEGERQKTAMDAAQTGSLLLSAFQQAKELGMDEPAMVLLFEKVFKIDAADAKKYASAIVKAKKDADAQQAAQSGFGGGGGGGFGGDGADGGFGGPDDEGGTPPGEDAAGTKSVPFKKKTPVGEEA